MSRVGKRPIDIPDGVDVSVDASTIRISGPAGELTKKLSDVVDVEVADNQILVERHGESRQARSHQGLIRSIISNLVRGATEGFEAELEIHGVGYRAERHGDFIRFDLGFSHAVLFELPEQVDVKLPSQTELILSSPDKELLGQVAAKIRSLRPPEPYKGKGIRYKDERIIRKVGKAGAATAAGAGAGAGGGGGGGAA